MDKAGAEQMNIPMYFAIRNKKTKKFISGTDFRYSPPRSLMANEYSPPMIFTTLNLREELKRRKINLKRYEVVLITINPYYTINMGDVNND